MFLPGGAPETTSDIPKAEVAGVSSTGSDVEDQQQQIGPLLFRLLSAPAEEPYPDDLPPVQVPDVVDENFSPNEALSKCARDAGVECVSIWGPGIMECASMDDGDHVPIVVTDTSPMRRFFSWNQEDGEDSTTFSMNMQVGPLGFADFTSPEASYVLDRSDPSDVRLQLGLMCQALVEDAHRTDFDPDWFCADSESAEACDARLEASIDKASRIKEVAPLVQDLEGLLVDLGLEGIRPNSVSQTVTLFDAEGNPRAVQFSVAQLRTWDPENNEFNDPFWSFTYSTGGFAGDADSPDAIFERAETFLLESE